MENIRGQTDVEEVDYTFLIDCLKNYASPRAKITRLLKNGDFIRVKKGLYVFGLKHQKQLVSSEILANKIFGPSYVSLEYALMFYGLIPEYVEEITSVTPKRNKQFSTPVGRFTYKHIPRKLFGVGFNLVSLGANRYTLMATPEKALADLLYMRKYKIANVEELKQLLFEDLRINSEAVFALNIELLTEIQQAGGSPILKTLIQLIRNLS